MSEVRVIKAGLLTTVQDLGRWGYQALGVSVSGPMDEYSHRLANALVGNGPDAATLEVTMLGPLLEFDDERIVAVTGGQFEASVDGGPVQTGGAFAVGAGSRLSLERRGSGARAYVAVSGGVGVPPVLGSRATHVQTRMGGFGGRPLKVGDRLPLCDALRPVGGRPITLARRSATTRPVVRVLSGLHREQFTDDAFRILQSEPYRISQDSDRTGYRLEGPPIPPTRRADMISEATPMGAVQIPGAGLPILLMADRQTAGGYPQIATVITADLHIVGQLGPGDTLSFVECSAVEAVTALIAQERALLAIERRETT